MALLPEHVTLKIVDGRIPDDGLVMRFLERHRIGHRVKLVRQHARDRGAGEASTRAREPRWCPSFFEGFGFPGQRGDVLRAAGHRKRRRSALPEVDRAGRSWPDAWCRPNIARAMAAAITDVLADPARTAAMGRAARQRVQSVFQWSDAAAGLVNVFEDTLRATHRRSRAA